MTQGPAVRSHLTSWNSRIFRENILSLCLLQSTILFNLGVSFLVSFKSNVKCVVHINIVTVKFFEIFNIITADSPQKLYKNPASLCNTYALIFFPPVEGTVSMQRQCLAPPPVLQCRALRASMTPRPQFIQAILQQQSSD